MKGLEIFFELIMFFIVLFISCILFTTFNIILGVFGFIGILSSIGLIGVSFQKYF